VDPRPASIAPGRWYDIRIQLKGTTIKCWLDGQLIHDIVKPRATVHRLYASATHDHKTGDIILKVVNTAAEPVNADLNLRGAQNLPGSGTAIVLTSESARDENSLEQPLKVSPQTQTFSFTGSQIKRTFPGNSVTVLRIASK
jgi:alpha-L-arabinofuranosidase